MKPLKPIHFKILAELMKNSTLSDRQAARILKDPAATRQSQRHIIEKRL